MSCATTLDRLWRAARFTSSYADPVTSESEDDFEDGLDFQEHDDSIAGIRRRLSDEAVVSRVGEALNQTLEADRDEGAPPRDHFSPVQVRFPVNAPALRPPTEEVIKEHVVVGSDNPEVDADNMPNAVNFDQANTADGEKAQDLARSVKVEFNVTDIKFWFSELEAEMTTAGIGQQWLKKTVLQRNLPTKQKEDVKSLLTLSQTEAGNDIYFKVKSELIRIYAPKPKDSYCKALTRTMVGLPSQLGNQIIDDICKKSSKLEGCCCAAAAQALWQLQLPVNIRQHTSNMEFNHATYKQVFEAADQVFLSARSVSVAALSVAQGAKLDETVSAFNPQNQPVPEVAAVGGGGKPPKKNKKNKKPTRGQKHSSVPDHLTEKLCDRHYTHAGSAWYCLKPSSCPWKDKLSPKQ